jgi:cytochrome c oxidase assembly protein subunit 11
MAAPLHTDPRRQRLNRNVAIVCGVFFVAMIGASYAAVPLYQMFCQVTGYGGTTQRVEQYSDTILDKTIKIRFDANVSGGIPWEFQPEQREITIRIGETAKAEYKAHNITGQTSRGRATYNVSPEMAGAYFNKVECFCFTDTELKPGETLDMPVVFFVDPAIVDVPELKNLTAITLSYTFFPLRRDEPVAKAAADIRTGG